jgi:hypothetical protein
MKRSWRSYLRRLAAVSFIGGSMAWSSAMCYAQNSFDSASDPAYTDGWQEGDNGGTGFTAWNWDAGYIFNNTNYGYASPIYAQIDDGLQNGTRFSNPHNSLGRSWAIGVSAQANEGAMRIGRGFSPLQVGDTLKVTFDPPTKQVFYKGYAIGLHGGSGGVNGNICNGGNSCSYPLGSAVGMSALGRWEYFNYGEWNLYDAGSTYPDGIGIFDADSSSQGAIYTVTRTGADSYTVSLNSIDPLKADFPSTTRTFESSGVEVDWIQFLFYNSNNAGIGRSDPTPTLAEPGTDIYIRSLEIIRAAPPGQPGDYNEDGKVDAADEVAWRKLPAEFGGDPGGYNTWHENFGEGSAGRAGGVPEPTNFMSLIVATAGLLATIRRSRSSHVASFQ